MKRTIRWIPAKRVSGLGQAAPVVTSSPPATAPVTVPAPTPAPVSDNQAIMKNLMYGGLIVAGLALVWAVMVGPSPDPMRSWE